MEAWHGAWGRPDQWGCPGAVCPTLDSWPSHINQICCSSHMSKQHDKPRLLPGTHRMHCQHSVRVCISHIAPPETFLQRSVETSKCFWHKYYRCGVCGCLRFSSRCSGWKKKQNKTNNWASQVTLKEEEVNFGPSGHLPQCLGNTWGYVRHYNRSTGTMEVY